MTQGPLAALLEDGKRLHLQHGPIDLLIGAEAGAGAGARAGARRRAFEAASERFSSVLEGLVSELHLHRARLVEASPEPADPVARRMRRACEPFRCGHFLTPMIAVAGSVADEILAAMLSAGPLRRAFVNNGGDVALHLEPEESFSVAMLGLGGDDLGRARFEARDGVGGIATSGWAGRSHSLGIADSVTVLARDAARADAAATLIANAVDLPGHPGVRRVAAEELQPDSDLGTRLVTVEVPALGEEEKETALRRGRKRAQSMLESGLILGAALFLQGASALAGEPFERIAAKARTRTGAGARMRTEAETEAKMEARHA